MCLGTPATLVLAALTACVVAAVFLPRPVIAHPGGEFVIRGGTVVDGSGAPPFAADVHVGKGRILAVVRRDDADGEEPAGDGHAVVDARGLVIAPGFIDTHSHGDDDLFTQPDAVPAVSQGITTIVVGQDGESPFPLADFLARLEQEPAAVNVAAYAGHNTLRARVLGADFRRAASDEEIEEMLRLLRRELESGALGLSTGLEYEPGIWSATGEVMALAKLAASAGGRYISHVRSEDRGFEDALDELIAIGRETGMPVHVSHLKLAMKRLWGGAPRIIARLDAARESGVDVSADLYPYEYWQSNLMVLLPERDPGDLETIAHALEEIAPPDGIWFTRYDPEPALVGMTLTEIAEARGMDPVTAFSELARASVAMTAETGKGADAIIGTSMREADIRELLLWEHTNICTDGGFEDRHPRARGAFTKVLADYVREQRLLSLEEAVHRMTGLSARHVGFGDRGLVGSGYRADLVMFDPHTVGDRATPEHFERLSTGIVSVWVSGEQVWNGTRATAARPGVVIRRQRD